MSTIKAEAAVQAAETALREASASMQYIAGRPTEFTAITYGMALVAYDNARVAYDAAVAAEWADAR